MLIILGCVYVSGRIMHYIRMRAASHAVASRRTPLFVLWLALLKTGGTILGSRDVNGTWTSVNILNLFTNKRTNTMFDGHFVVG